MKNTQVAAIIPALNEAPTIAGVIDAVKSCPIVDEIIVVSDGSTDQTASIARTIGASVIELDQSSGKGNAMRLGASKTHAPVLLFLDADLKHLTADHVEQLLLPVISGENEMSIGLLPKGPLTSLQRHVLKISGQRALRREVLESIPEEFTKGFMIETAMTHWCKANKKPFDMIVLRDVGVRRKFEKNSIGKATWQYIKMWLDILKAHLLITWARFNGKF